MKHEGMKHEIRVNDLTRARLSHNMNRPHTTRPAFHLFTCWTMPARAGSGDKNVPTHPPVVDKNVCPTGDFRRALVILCVLCASAVNSLRAASIPPPGNEIPAADRQVLGEGADALAKQIDALRVALKDKPDLLALLPDVQIYHKAIDWPLRYHELIDVKKARAALARGMERAAQLKEGKRRWLIWA